MKKREILTYPLTKEQLWTELCHCVEYFRGLGIRECSVLFGFAWGNEYYPGTEWTPEVVPIDRVGEKVMELEDQGLGELGHDDVFIEIADLEFRYCNDSDVHLGFDRHQPVIEDFYSRWDAMGYYPAEWLKNQAHGPGERVRGGKPDG